MISLLTLFVNPNLCLLDITNCITTAYLRLMQISMQTFSFMETTGLFTHMIFQVQKYKILHISPALSAPLLFPSLDIIFIKYTLQRVIHIIHSVFHIGFPPLIPLHKFT